MIHRRQLILGALGAAAPAIAKTKKVNQWKMVTTWPKNFPGLGTGANLLAKTITELSEGQIDVKVYGAGEVVPALSIFDAVSRGTAQMGHGAAYYWRGKNEAAQFFATVPFGLTGMEMNAWLAHGGGQKLWDELYAKFNLKPFAAGNTGVSMGGWFNKPINTIKDFKGLKFRMPGLGGEVLRRVGATVVTIPGGEVFGALKGGTIDASEWLGPYNDLAFGLHKAAKYYYWPGWHEPGTTIEAFVNRKAYNQLSKHLQTVVRVACAAANQAMFAEFTARNAESLQTLTDKHKVKIRQFPLDVLKKLKLTSDAVVAEIGAKDSFSKSVYASYVQFQKKSSSWMKISEQGYSLARSL